MRLNSFFISNQISMSLPKSRILTTTKGFSAAAELHSNSPEQNTVINLNVNHSSVAEGGRTSSEPKESQTIRSIERSETIERPQTPAPSIPIAESNPYATLEPGAVQYQERSIDTAKESVQDVEAIIKSKDNIINAYALMLDIIENNPLLVNKYVVAEIDSLTLLISYLTEAERVDIQESLDVDCSCSGHPKFVPVDKIYITKHGETQNFKYSYPNANKILDDHHISVKFVVDRTLQ